MVHAEVLGWYGHKNCGDESYKLSFPKIFPKYKLNFTDNINKLTGKTLFVGGGDIVYDNMISKIATLKCEKHLFSVSLTSCDCLPKLKDVFSSISVRDRKSFEKLKSIGISATYLPDAAFALVPNKVRGSRILSQLFAEAGAEQYKKKVIVTFNAYLGPREAQLAREEIAFLKVAHDISGIADTTPASFVFLPFSTSSGCDDRVTNAFTAALCKFWKKNLVVYKDLPPQDILDIHSAADAVISTRLHGSIFSTIAGTPFVDLTHHNKNGDYLKSNGLNDWSVNYWSLDKEIVYQLLHSHLSNTEAHSRLLKIAAEHRKALSSFTDNWPFPK